MIKTGNRTMVLQAAREQFAETGFHDTAVETILRQARLSKNTLYAGFSNKDALIIATLIEYRKQWLGWFAGAVEEYSIEPMERLVGLFDVLGAWFQQPSFRGCLITQALMEYPAPKHPIHKAALRQKRIVHTKLHEWVKKALRPAPDSLCTLVDVLFDGAILTAQYSPESEPAKEARAILELVIRTFH